MTRDDGPTPHLRKTSRRAMGWAIFVMGWPLILSRAQGFPFPPQPLREVVYPADAGVINVKDHGVKGDGVTDDTAALQALITANLRTGNILYFPNGTYLISDSLNYGPEPAGLTLQGQSRNGVILRLKDNAPGFGNATETGAKPILEMVRKSNDHVYGNGFNLYVRNLTIHTGAGNPGAIGIRFIGNNTAGISDVTIISGHAQKDGWAGIAFDRRSSGPAFHTRIEIDGFRQGIRSASRNYCEVFEDVILRNQTQYGVYVGPSTEPLTFRRLTSVNRVPVIFVAQGTGPNQFRFAQVTVVDGHFIGGSYAVPAIENGSFVVLKNVRAEGYQRLVTNTQSDTRHLDPLQVDRVYVSDVTHSLFPSNPDSVGLSVAETPMPPDTPPTQWVRVVPGAISTATVDGKTERRAQLAGPLQAAIDQAAAQGRDTVYIPRLGGHGEKTRWWLNSTITIKGSVRRIVGMGCLVEITAPLRDGTGNVFVLDPSVPAGAYVHVEDLVFSPGAEGRLYNFTLFHHRSSRAHLVLRNIGAPSAFSYKASSGAGNVYIENCSFYENTFVAGQKIWARQYNTESQNAMTVLDGAEMWVLGIKTENHGEVVRATNAKLEIWGGYLTPSWPNMPVDRVAFDLIDSWANITVQFDGSVSSTGSGYHNMVRETRGGTTRISNVRNYPLWGSYGGGTIQLFTSIPQDADQTPYNRGYALRELWATDNLPTDFNNPATWDAKTPNLRSQTTAAIAFYTHQNFAIKYDLGFYERIRLRPVAPMTGTYRFFVHRGNTGDQVIMHWNADGDPNSTTILTLSSDPNNSLRLRSGPISLTAGQAPFVDVFLRRAQSTALASVGWYLPDGRAVQRLGNEDLLGFRTGRGTPRFSGRYVLVCKQDGKALSRSAEIFANDPQGDYVISCPLNRADANQRWEIVDVGSGYYRLINEQNLESLHRSAQIFRGHPDGNYAITYPSASSGTFYDRQRWQIVDLGAGYYRLVNKADGKALHQSMELFRLDSNGNYVITFPISSGNDRQSWQILRP